jgi:hypothetical protein
MGMGDTDSHTDEPPRDAGDDRTLTRRDAIGALSAAGVTAAAGCSSLLENSGASDEGADPTAADDHELRTMRALAGVLYPADIEITDDFFQTYLYSRIADEDAYETELRAAVETLDGLAESRHGAVFRTLDTAHRESTVTETDVRSGASEPDGTDTQRLNYHLVDELLFACYASPTGGGLVGNENPRGWPGGFGYAPEVRR